MSDKVCWLSRVPPRKRNASSTRTKASKPSAIGCSAADELPNALSTPAIYGEQRALPEREVEPISSLSAYSLADQGELHQLALLPSCIRE